MRIAGITIPEKKRLEIGLTAVYGVGRTRAQKVLADAGVDAGVKPGDLSTAEEGKLRDLIESFTIEGDLRRHVSGNIKRLKDTQSHRGICHSRGLPTRGQRTKTNSRTRRGNVRNTRSSGKRSVEKK